MDVPRITKSIQHLQKEKSHKVNNSALISGAFKIHAVYAENIKPTHTNGYSNPYIMLSVPDNTVVPPPELPPNRKTGKVDADALTSVQPKETVLTGSARDLLR